MKRLSNKCFVFFCILFSSVIFSQEIIHVPKGNGGIVGFWQHVIPIKDLLRNKTIYRITGNYKVINPDHTFYNFSSIYDDMVISGYGTYQITSDSTLIEHSAYNKNNHFDNIDLEIKFKKKSDDVFFQQFTIEGKTIHEAWRRVKIGRQSKTSKEVKKL